MLIDWTMAGTAHRTLSGHGWASSSEVTPPDPSCQNTGTARPTGLHPDSPQASANVRVRPRSTGSTISSMQEV
jgi:hypothetical protein